MTTNKLRVDYSPRYAAWVILDSHGAQQFANNGLPLVFTTRESALRRIA